VWAEKSNVERYATHFSAFDLSAISGFFFCSISTTDNVSGQVSKELWTGTTTAFDYAYDARSRLTGITRSATDKVNWTYNTAGLVTSEITTIPQVTSALGASSVTSTMNYAYDTAGRTTSKSLSNGSTVQYTDAMVYDFRDRMTQQTRTQSSGGSLWSKFTYNTLDLVTIAEQGTGSVTSNPELVQTTTRDLAGRPTSISYQSGTNSLATYSMAYVSESNRLASLTTPQGTTNYGYSANGQLIQAGSTGYTYDANGNPTNRAGKTTQIGTWNRLLDDGDFTYQYDAEGRTTGRTSKTTGQTESYVWNRRGQLTQIDVHSNAAMTNLTGQVNYSYDPTGRRTSVRNQTGIGSGSYAQSVDYLMSDGDQVGQILGATGQTTRRFRYGIGVDSVLSEQRFSGGTASNPEYQLTDHLGTVRGVAQRTTGVNAAVVNALQYDSFGKLISQSNASKQPYHGFAGRDIEPVGGLTYNRNRYYSTQTGRFISQDPIGFAAGDENLYRYVGNSPTNATDPTGLETYVKGLPLHNKTGYWWNHAQSEYGPQFRGNGIFKPFAADYIPTNKKSETPRFMFDPIAKGVHLRIPYKDGVPDFSRWQHSEMVKGKKTPAVVEIQLTSDLEISDDARRSRDYTKADNAYRDKIKNKNWQRPDGYTWHHQTVDRTGKGQMLLIRTDVHEIAKHWGPYSVYRDLQLALQRKDKKAMTELLERASAFKTLRMVKLAAGGVGIIFTAQSAYGGFQKDGTWGAVEAAGKDITCQEELGHAIYIPNEFVYGTALGIDPDSTWDEEWRLIQFMQNMGVNPSGLHTQQPKRNNE
jgi:RHS repeat-associated protein